MSGAEHGRGPTARDAPDPASWWGCSGPDSAAVRQYGSRAPDVLRRPDHGVHRERDRALGGNRPLEHETQGLAGNQPLTLATRYLGSFTIAPSTTSTNLTDAQVVAELIAQIASGALPPPRVAFNGPVTEYYVMFPPTYRICLGTDCSNTQFCAYHSNAAYLGTPFTYTVLPESTPTNSGCGASSAGGGFGNLTSMTSHELVESVTDPEVGSASAFVSPLAWYDQSNGEVADICNGQQATLTLDASTWTVQKQ